MWEMVAHRVESNVSVMTDVSSSVLVNVIVLLVIIMIADYYIKTFKYIQLTKLCLKKCFGTEKIYLKHKV